MEKLLDTYYDLIGWICSDPKSAAVFAAVCVLAVLLAMWIF